MLFPSAFDRILFPIFNQGLWPEGTRSESSLEFLKDGVAAKLLLCPDPSGSLAFLTSENMSLECMLA